jgi:hypothetical protein
MVVNLYILNMNISYMVVTAYIHPRDHLPLEFVLPLSLLGEFPRPRGIDGLSRLASFDFDLLFIDSICSSASTTSFMDGRLFGSPDRHLRVS